MIQIEFPSIYNEYKINVAVLNYKIMLYNVIFTFDKFKHLLVRMTYNVTKDSPMPTFVAFLSRVNLTF